MLGLQPPEILFVASAACTAFPRGIETAFGVLDVLQGPREKKKRGRPIIYSGDDPDAPGLTAQARKCIRARIAKRESRRCAHARRQDLNEDTPDEWATITKTSTSETSISESAITVGVLDTVVRAQVSLKRTVPQ